MNNILYFDQLLEAKRVGILYHYTHFTRVASMLQENMIRTSNMEDAVSFTRNKMFHLSPGYGVDTSARMVLDGDKISEKYKITPYAINSLPVKVGDDGDFERSDFEWQAAWKGHPKSQDIGTVEAEERISKPLKDLRKYIIRIDLKKDLLDKSRDPVYSYNYRHITELVKKIETLGITVGLY